MPEVIEKKKSSGVQTIDEQVLNLIYAARVANVCAVRSLIARGADIINGADAGGDTALHYAVIANRNAFALTEFLLRNEANVNAKNKKLITPLHLACAHSGDVKLVGLLIDHGAELNAKDKNGCTPLSWAQYREPAGKDNKKKKEKGRGIVATILATIPGKQKGITSVLIKKGADQHVKSYVS